MRLYPQITPDAAGDRHNPLLWLSSNSGLPGAFYSARDTFSKREFSVCRVSHHDGSNPVVADSSQVTEMARISPLASRRQKTASLTSWTLDLGLTQSHETFDTREKQLGIRRTATKEIRECFSSQNVRKLQHKRCQMSESCNRQRFVPTGYTVKLSYGSPVNLALTVYFNRFRPVAESVSRKWGQNRILT